MPIPDSTRPEGSLTAAQQHLRQKRARSQLSCTPCRLGKLKCNRQHPHCDQCLKRSRETQCVFLPPPPRSKLSQNVKGRIKQLETLVVDLMNQQTDGASSGGNEHTRNAMATGKTADQLTPSSDDEGGLPSCEEAQLNDRIVLGVERPLGQMRVSKAEISYHGASHWQTILDSISDLRRDLGDDEIGDGDKDTGEDGSPESISSMWNENSKKNMPVPTTGLGFMLGHNTGAAMSKEDLLKASPDKRVADRLLSMWFNSPDPLKPCIHAPTFQNEYRRFWQKPKQVPVMWLGLLFSILSMAESFGLRDSKADDPKTAACVERVNRYHSMAASAAVLADFTKTRQYTLECLIVYAAGMRSGNAFLNIWLMIGLIIRLALRMGYHRSPEPFTNITPFQGEMRRRAWASIYMIDVLISFQLGLPSLVRTLAADTEPPRNLLDRDFDENCKELPPGRGIEELTPSSYTRAKFGLVGIFAQTSELGHTTSLVSHDEVMRLDAELEQAKAAIPPLLQLSEFNDFVTDTAEQLMCRFNLELLYLKTKIVLHRRYMLVPLDELSPEEQVKGVGHSRLLCVGSALKVLKHHHTIYDASQPGGQLDTVRWYMCSISTHDFLLAAMVLCLELSQQMREDRMIILSNGQECPRRQDMIHTLEHSHKIWAGSATRSTEASTIGAVGLAETPVKAEGMFGETEKASKAMAVMLERVKKHFKAMPLSSNAAISSGTQAAQAGMANYEPPILDDRSAPDGQFAFRGVVPNMLWSNELPGTTGLTSLTSEAFSQAALGSAGQDNMFEATNVPMDYSNIGDMLDLPLNMDWDDWDDTVMRAEVSKHSDGVPNAAPAQLNSAYNLILANHGDSSGFAGLPGAEEFPVQGNDFGLDLRWEDLQGVDLDIRDYGAGELWGREPSWV